MKKILIIFFGLFLLSCTKQDDCDTGKLPDCIQQIIDVSSVQPFLTVKMQKVNGECHYWLNTGANAWCGLEYIINDKCDTVCYYGGKSLPTECSEDFSFDKWEIVWQP